MGNIFLCCFKGSEQSEWPAVYQRGHRSPFNSGQNDRGNTYDSGYTERPVAPESLYSSRSNTGQSEHRYVANERVNSSAFDTLQSFDQRSSVDNQLGFKRRNVANESVNNSRLSLREQPSSVNNRLRLSERSVTHECVINSRLNTAVHAKQLSRADNRFRQPERSVAHESVNSSRLNTSYPLSSSSKVLRSSEPRNDSTRRNISHQNISGGLSWTSLFPVPKKLNVETLLQPPARTVAQDTVNSSKLNTRENSEQRTYTYTPLGLPERSVAHEYVVCSRTNLTKNPEQRTFLDNRLKNQNRSIDRESINSSKLNLLKYSEQRPSVVIRLGLQQERSIAHDNGSSFSLTTGKVQEKRSSVDNQPKRQKRSIDRKTADSSKLNLANNSEQRPSADNRLRHKERAAAHERVNSSRLVNSTNPSYANVTSRNISTHNVVSSSLRTDTLTSPVLRKISVEELIRNKNRNNVKSLNFQCHSSINTTLLWNNLENKIYFHTKVIEIEMCYFSKIHEGEKSTRKQRVNFNASGNCIDLPRSGFIYHIVVHFFQGCDSNNERDLLESAYGSFISVLNKNELKELMLLAKSVINGRTQVKVLYRNKPAEYFDDIHKNNHSVMKPYKKDFHGDPGCPINGKLDGLFFAASLHGESHGKSKSLPETSPFGNTRIIIPVDKLVNHSNKLYFADFYCNSVPHYVTLVITKPDSKADQFCANHLVTLDLSRNSFMWMYQGNVYIPNGVHTDIMYTENIDISSYELTRVQTRGKGRSTKTGIPKKGDCSTCNLYPKQIDDD